MKKFLLQEKITILSIALIIFLACENEEKKKKTLENRANLNLRDEHINCGEVVLGELISRVKYKHSRPKGSCESEVQIATCEENGKFSEFSGIYTYNECLAGCENVTLGESISRKKYKELKPKGSCESEVQTATCEGNGKFSKFSGTYTYDECLAGCENVTLGEAVSRKKYKESKPKGSCESEVQIATCEGNGKFSKFSGTYTYNECLAGCGEIRHNENLVGVPKYRSSHVEHISECKEETIVGTCLGGKFVENQEYKHEYCGTFPLIDLRFSDDSINKLQKYREEAILMGGSLLKEQKKEVSGFLYYKGKEIPIKARLKGDGNDHWTDNKRFSLRIKIKSDDTLLGMRKFSIQKKKTRSPLQSLWLRYMKYEGLLTPKTRYISYRVNNDDLGIMSIEEHFSREFLESQGMRESVIFTPDESYVWYPGSVPIYFVPWKVYKSKTMRNNTVLTSLFNEGVSYFRGFKEQKIKAEDVLDMKKLAKIIALTNLFEGNHALNFHNQKFYFNPFTRKFEVIAFDARFSNKDKVIGIDNYSNPLSSIKFITFYKTYLQALKRKILDESLFKDLNEINKQIMEQSIGKTGITTGLRYIKNVALSRINAMLAQELPIEKNKYFLYSPKHSRPNTKEFLIVYYYNKNNVSYLEFINTTNLPVDVTSIKLKTQNGSEFERIEDFKIPPQVFEKDRVKIEVPSYKEIKDTYIIQARSSNDPATERLFQAHYYSSVAAERSKKSPDLSSFFNSHPFFELTEESVLFLRKGTYNFFKDLILPDGYDLLIKDETNLNFSKNVSIITSGNILIEGSAESKVRLNAIDPSVGWGGLKSTATDKIIKIKFAEFSDIVFQKETGLGLTGAISIYEGKINFDNVTIINTQAEDALNIVRGEIKLQNITIKNTISDAIDLDSSRGKISNSSFTEIGGDGLDISSSHTVVNNLTLENIFDKGISIGEKSFFWGDNILVNRAAIGIASKDESLAYVENSSFMNISKVAFTAYIKKREYGASKLIVKKTNVEAYLNLIEERDECKVTFFSNP